MPENGAFIVAAFALTWVVLLGYAWHLHRVRREAARRLDHATRDAIGGRS